MGVLTEVKRRFRGDPSPKEEKEFTAAQIWGVIGLMVGEKDDINFRVESKLEREELPEGLRDWEFYDKFEGPFTVAVSGQFGMRQITITAASYFLKVVSRGPKDASPSWEQGKLVPDGTIDFPFNPQDNLKFADDLSKFVWWLHRRHNQPQTPQIT